MRISIIAAMGRNRVIGKNGALPWHLPADLAHFKILTMSHPIVMGRKTHESISRALPGRTNIVITRQPNYQSKDCVVVSSMEEVLKRPEGEIFVIGGAEMYRAFLPHARRLYLTLVGGDFEGDAYFPELNMAEWQETARAENPADEKNQNPYTFVTYERIAKSA